MSTNTIPAEGGDGWAMSQGLLIAVLHHVGGFVDLPAEALDKSVMGDAEGRLHAVAMEPLPDGRGMRLSVQRVDVEEVQR